MNRFKRSGQSSPQQAITILVLFSALAVAALFTFALPTLQRYLMLKDADPIQTAETDLDALPADGFYFIDDATVLDGYCYTGGSAEDAFHLVLPSLPGFGFSNPVPGPGWAPTWTPRGRPTSWQNATSSTPASPRSGRC